MSIYWCLSRKEWSSDNLKVKCPIYFSDTLNKLQPKKNEMNQRIKYNKSFLTCIYWFLAVHKEWQNSKLTTGCYGTIWGLPDYHNFVRNQFSKGGLVNYNSRDSQITDLYEDSVTDKFRKSHKDCRSRQWAWHIEENAVRNVA